MAGLVTIWLMITSLFWYSDSGVNKILSFIIGGLPGLVAVILVQLFYEGFFVKCKETESETP